MVHELSLIHGVHKVLKDFFYDRNTFVVGVGIEKVAAKLQKDFGIIFNKCVELRGLTSEPNKGLENKDFSQASVAELAKAVTGGEIDYVKPKRMSWWTVPLRDDNLAWFRKRQRWDPRDHYNRHEFLSDDIVKHAAVEAFLVGYIGMILLPELRL